MSLLDPVINFASRIMGTDNKAQLRKLWPLVQQVRAREAELLGLDDQALRDRSQGLIERVRSKGESLDAVLPEALAIAREGADRRIGMWNALDPVKGLPDEAWGDQLAVLH